MWVLRLNSGHLKDQYVLLTTWDISPAHAGCLLNEIQAYQAKTEDWAQHLENSSVATANARPPGAERDSPTESRSCSNA